jgi:hypothetical protein
MDHLDSIIYGDPRSKLKFLENDVMPQLIREIPCFIEGQAKRRRRARREKVDLWSTEWGQLLQNPQTNTPGTFEFKKFRLRFRVPFPLFNERIIPAVREAKIFNKERASYIPLEFKVMIALRIMGRDTDCDTACELSGVPKSTCNTIFKQFCEGFSHCFYDDFVYFPKDGTEELKKTMDTFARVGFPGAVGSMDVTHFRWFACPEGEYNNCKGKYPYPTLACQAIVDHNRRIFFMSDLYDGRENDKNITSNDDFTYAILNGLFNKVKYKLYDEDGVLHLVEGGYIIVDGGYQSAPCLVDPMHDANGVKEVHWSEFLESVRKDVECAFGILKTRFRMLRNGVDYARRTANGQGGYIIQVSNESYLDCYQNAHDGRCLASIANCARNCNDKTTGRPAQNNCHMRVQGLMVTLYSKKNVFVPAHRELLHAYNTAYVFPK